MDLTGAQAVERLERRGGQVWLFRGGHGSRVTFECVGREDGAAIIRRAPGERGDRTIRTDADRKALAVEMEAAMDEANSGLDGPGSRYGLRHRDILDADAGYAQIGCVLALVSTFVGLVLGMIISWLATGHPLGPGLIVGPIIGFCIGLFGIDPIAGVAVNVPAMRDRIETIAYAWEALIPGLVTTTIIVGAAMAEPG